MSAHWRSEMHPRHPKRSEEQRAFCALHFLPHSPHWKGQACRPSKTASTRQIEGEEKNFDLLHSVHRLWWFFDDLPWRADKSGNCARISFAPCSTDRASFWRGPFCSPHVRFHLAVWFLSSGKIGMGAVSAKIDSRETFFLDLVLLTERAISPHDILLKDILI